MRWPIRAQLLLPLVLLLLGVVGISIGTGLAAAHQARRQIEDRLRNLAGFLSDESWFPLNAQILRQLKPLSGADLPTLPGSPSDESWFPPNAQTPPHLNPLSGPASPLAPADGPPLTSLDADPGPLPAGAVADDWRSLRLGPTVTAAGRAYLC